MARDHDEVHAAVEANLGDNEPPGIQLRFHDRLWG